MAERSRDTELSVVEGLWSTLDNQQLIKDVVMKGKFISNAIKFLAKRNNISIEKAKDFFFEELFKFVNSLIRNKQLHRASHVLKNVQLDEFFYLFDFHQNENDEVIKDLVFERLSLLDLKMKENKDSLIAYHIFFKLLISNFPKHAKFMENVNRSAGSSLITGNNIEKVIFGTFMKQPMIWKNELATDIFFKSKNFHLRHILDKHCFFTYILRNEFYSILKQWLQEAYWGRAGKMIQSTISEPETFEAALLSLFREWKFEEKMMDQIARREKDVIKNEFAKLGLFEKREAKSICRMLNRFFTTQTFHENFKDLKTDQVTKFIIENSLMDLLSEKFIDYHYIELLLENLDVIYMRDELSLVKKMKNLMKPETGLEEFLNVMIATTNYICEFDKKFVANSPELKLINETIRGLPASDFDKIAETNSFTNNLTIKLKSKEEELPTVEILLESNHSINLDFIRDEFEKNEAADFEVSFNDKNLSSSYADTIKLNYVNYVSQHQSSFASYLLIKDIIKNFITISRSQIFIACDEVGRLVVERPEDRELVSHVMTFLEIFSVDSRNLRCFLRLMKLCPSDHDETQDFASNLNDIVIVGANEYDLRNVEALEVFWTVRKIKEPARSYLNPFFSSNDWFRLVLLAQYLNYSLSSFISICDARIDNQPLRNNLIRAVLFDSAPDQKQRCSFSKRRKSKSAKCEENRLFTKGKFLDLKRDLFAILLKCDERLERYQMKFEEFQKMLFNKEETDDLLCHAMKHDWPILAVLAATTKLYRKKFCWISWLLLSSDYKLNRKFKTLEELSQDVISHCLDKSFIQTLDDSTTIFYPESALKTLTTFFRCSKEGNVLEMETILKQFIVKLGELNYKMIAVKGKNDSMNFSMHCILKHLQVNFQSNLLQEKYLDALCRSEISQFSEKIDFALMKKMCKILERTNMPLDYAILAYTDEKGLLDAIGVMCESMIEDHHFEAAIELSDLMNLPKGDFVFKWWIHMWNFEDRNSKNFETKKYMKYVNKYHLSIDVMIKFLNTVVKDLEPCVKKFNMMKFILRNSFIENPTELDALEYEIITLYVQLKLDQNLDVKPLMSVYFETVISKEKSIFHDPLYELKSIAKVDELTVSQKFLEDEMLLEQLDLLIHQLLNTGDFVQVLRIQEMFGRAPEDLKLLVYIMSIAEGINSIYDITKEERKMISSYGMLSNKFNRLTLRTVRTNSSNSCSSSPSNDLSESINLDDSTHRNSYKENKETFQALQGLVCKMKHGVVHAQRIALMYRASLFLNKNFVDLMKMKDSFEILELAATTDCENKLLVMHDIMIATQMTDNEIAEFIAKEIAACIIRTRFMQFNKDTELLLTSTSSWSPRTEAIDDIWGFNLIKDLHLILELCTSTTVLGNYLLKYYSILSKESADIPLSSEDAELDRICQHLNRMLDPQIISLKKQNIIRVELLVTAHECFCHECSTEGIGLILTLSKSLCSHLAAKKSFTLIVKLMCGIERYREMFYCFEILIKNEQFEALLGQFTDKQTNSLKMAILSYLNEYHPTNKEYYKMAASHFMMYTELANIWRSDALDKIRLILNSNQVKFLKTGRINSNQLQQVEIPYFKCNKKILNILNNEVLTAMIHATEMVSMDNKIDLSIKFSSFCELIAVQIHLVKIGLEKDDQMCPCVINQDQSADKFQYLANYELTVPQTIILMKNTDVKIDFSKAIFVHLLLEDEAYLHDFMSRCDLTDQMIENVVKITQLDSISTKQEKILNDLIVMVSDKGLKFRLASLLGLKAQLHQMLNDQGTYYYLLDSKYGTVDVL